MSGSQPAESAIATSASARQLQRLVRLAARLSGAVSVHDVGQAVVTAGAEELAADSVTVYVLDDDGERLDLVASAGMDPELQQQFSTMAVADPVPGGDALRKGEVLSYETVAERNARYPGFQDHPGGCGTVIVAPMVLNDGLRVGIMSIGWYAEHQATPEALQFARAVADLCGQAVHRAQLFDWQRQSYLVQRFLADSTRLLNASLDLDATLHEVAHLAVPDIVDVCAVCLAEADGTLRPVVAATADPERQEILDKLVARQPVVANPTMLQIADSGEGVLIPVMDAADREESAQDEEHLGLLHALHTTSALIVPLRTRGRTLGLLLLLMTGDRRTLAPADLALAEDLAGRAAMAIDNARLYTELDQRADNLAHALESRIIIEQAKGMLAGRWGVDPGVAFDRLRQISRRQRRNMHDLAAAVLDGTAELDLADDDGTRTDVQAQPTG